MSLTINEQRALIFLAIFYVVGLVGFTVPIYADFAKLTPFNLLLSLGVALSFHRNWSFPMVLCLWICGVAGFFIEVVGTNTGWIFGIYHYGKTLGFQLWNTPLSMAINWILTTYSAGMSVQLLLEKKHIITKIIVGALLMVSLDVLIEPIAMRFDFWQWENNIVPMKNYRGWFFSSLPLLLFFFLANGERQNKVAFGVFILQITFFFLLNFIFNFI
jgi:putative membrane protein